MNITNIAIYIQGKIIIVAIESNVAEDRRAPLIP